ncbi:MAG: 3-oxoacyl-ACP reductase family protein [bacterium]|nr:3-oxoacyl-ACP reductase family protein [bacterium]
MRLKEKVALVTGGSRGIGRAVALELAKEGADIGVNYAKNKAAADEIVSKIHLLGRNAIPIQADVGKITDIERMVEQIWEEFGRIDILVNNAGIAYIEPFFKVSEETWDRTLDVNLKGTFFTSQIVANKMIKKQIEGRIINVSATNGQVAEVDTVHYNASKGGMDMVTCSLAIELAPFGIRVNGIAPGIIKTEIDVDFFADSKFKEHYQQHIPMRRFGEVEEVGKTAVFLASDDSSYITGHTIVIDGGLLCEQVPKLQN